MEIRDVNPRGKLGQGGSAIQLNAIVILAQPAHLTSDPTDEIRRLEINSGSTITDSQAYLSLLSRAQAPSPGRSER